MYLVLAYTCQALLDQTGSQRRCLPVAPLQNQFDSHQKSTQYLSSDFQQGSCQGTNGDTEIVLLFGRTALGGCR